MKRNEYSICGSEKKKAPKGSGTIRRSGLVGVGVVSSEEVCHCGERLSGLIHAQDTAQ